MLDNKTTRIEIRITEQEKQQLKKYVSQHNTTVSKLFREIIKKLAEEEENNNEQK